MDEQTQEGTQEESLVSQMIDDEVVESPQTEETPKEETPKEETSETVNEVTEETQEELLITEELAKSFGVSKSFIGKPIEELAKSHKEALKWGTENSQQLKEMSKQLEELKSGLNQKQVESAQEVVEDELGDMPDPVDDPKGFKDYMKSFKKALRDEAIKEAKAQIENDPSIKTAQDLAAKQSEEMTLKLIQSSLGEDEKADEVLQNWFEANEKYVPQLMESGIYKNNPEKLANDILQFHKANSFDALKSAQDSDTKLKIHQKTKENLARVKPSMTKSSTSPRTETKNGGLVSEMLEEELQAQGYSNQ